MHSREKAWSELTDSPVMFYLEEYDEHLVYWFGFLLPHIVALNMAMEPFGIYPSPKMKEHLFIKYKQLYYSDAFDMTIDNFGDFTGHSVLGYIRASIGKQISAYAAKTTISSILFELNTNRLHDDK